MPRRFGLFALLGSIVISTAAFAADWPRFRGANCDGISTETGLNGDWAAKPPALLWQLPGMGRGFSSLSIIGNVAYTMGDFGQDQKTIAIDLATQKILWSVKTGRAWRQNNDPGSRCTPTVDGDFLYVVGGTGDMACVDRTKGSVVWQKDFAKDFGGKMMSGWGYAESPLVDGDRVIVTPGGRDAMIVALNKKTGEVIWKAAVPNLGPKGRDGAGYSSIVAAEIAGVKQYITLVGKGGIGVAAADGKFLWGYNKAANGVANITTPVVKGDLVFFSSAYNTGSGLVKLSSDGKGGVKADEVYFLDAKTFQNHHGGVVLIGDYLYGGHNQNAGIPTCIDFKTGKIMWTAKAPSGGSAAVFAYEDRLIFRYEKGAVVALVEPSPEGFKLKGQFKAAVDEGPSWSHPVIHDGKLYLRTQDVLMCYDLK